MSGYNGPHTRLAANGYGGEISIKGPAREEGLRYGQKITILVEGKEKSAVVDLMVAAFWGGPVKAFRHYHATGQLFHVERKIVWQRLDGGWEEKRSISDATLEEYLEWREQFDQNHAPPPMPERYVL